VTGKSYRLLGPDGEPRASHRPGTFGGNSRARIYGRLDCPAALKALPKGYAKHRVFFADEAAAIAAGYRPCGRCLRDLHAVWRRGGEPGSVGYPWLQVPKGNRLVPPPPGDASLRLLEARFHSLIRARAAEFGAACPASLPLLSASLVGEASAAWFPVPGMYGGFKYRLEADTSGMPLICESWCRVAGGSGQRHRVTLDGAVLLESGFV